MPMFKKFFTVRNAISTFVIALSLAQLSHTQDNQQFKIGDTIPATLTVTDSTGKAHTMGSFRGQPVVLEWTNFQCPFVRKHYDSKNLQNLQKKYTDQGVKWLAVISSASGKQGHLTFQTAPEALAKEGFNGTALILDETGALGRQFGAETTPHLFVVNAEGQLAYRGAIDSIPSFSAEDIAKADNYVAKALDQLLAGQKVTTPQTKSYGCSVKY